MGKIIRTPTQAKGGITKAEAAALKSHTDKWIANAMRTDTVDRERLTAAILSLYSASGLPAPRVVIVPSPRVMALAGGYAAAIWHVRKHKHNDATYDATDDATRDATDDATSAATYAATRDATSAATYDATRDATDDATSAATDEATYAATRDATYDATRLSIAARYHVSHRLLGECARSWWRMYQGGNMWGAWPCCLSAFRDVLGLRLPVYEKYAAWEACAIEGGFRMMHAEFCMVSDRPSVLRVDDEHRPHCESGPSHLWRDGWVLYHIHGVRIPAERAYIVEYPERITVAEIEAETNSELRRILIDRYGPARYVLDSGASVVDQCAADHPMQGLRTARLLRKPVPDDEPVVYVDLLNSTPEPDGSVKRYQLRVDPRAYGGDASVYVQAAAASTWRNADGSMMFSNWRDYAPIAES